MPATLFDELSDPRRPSAPLAARLRPQTLDEVLGQSEALAEGSPLRRLVAGGSGTAAAPSVILWGPPGSGKTTLATLIAAAANRRFVELSAVTAGVKDVREVLAAARDSLATGADTVLFVDEVHRFSKTQQDALLPAVENGLVTLVAATTENPSFAIIAPLLSRSIVVRLSAMTDEDVATLLERAVTDPRGLRGEVRVTDEATAMLVRLAGGDARRALTALEAEAGAAAATGVVDTVHVERAIQTAVVRYDRAGDQHYDVTSALIKSIRGSDVDAALHYLARMVEAGEDPRFIARRLVILASEDIGMADPAALPVAVAAMQAVSFIGLPEARLTLAQAVVQLALAPKSNAVYRAMNAAQADVRAGLTDPVPEHLRDGSYAGAADFGHGVGYVYPHDEINGVAAQPYAPESVRSRRYYQPTGRGAEGPAAERLARINAILHPDEAPHGDPTVP